MILANVIHVVENPLKVLQENHRILKVGGVLIVITFTNFGMKWFEKIKIGIKFGKTKF